MRDSEFPATSLFQKPSHTLNEPALPYCAVHYKYSTSTLKYNSGSVSERKAPKMQNCADTKHKLKIEMAAFFELMLM